ncbi:nucleotidyl transferase AbiEii/AbiGii toxin family protein [Algoriphagus persicinus]|uniref:nucleotidyl transferase AbiEii/AbiGii toxin family protein n=1 Tax=Algoriphagus persicinus TaxID=3108754 RepID=UPI002B3B68D6|nr:nucleotidyl transferase AbiEii/AbiGii toxin family protein [Algoriphagus sp. E1-3-M2]MEB2783627.1 nucleotidyltransferase [Algoriphagus sp. E1-3-M2]
MKQIWQENISGFIELANKYEVKMLLVGGGAVNFHGYQRHSADVDFWIKTDQENLSKLVATFNEMGFEIEEFPVEVRDQMKNISVKFTPEDLDLELITRFEIGKTFDEAYESADEVDIVGFPLKKWKVLNYEDLIESKLRAARAKDLLDIDQLKRNKAL